MAILALAITLLLGGTLVTAGSAGAAPFIDVTLQPSEVKDAGGGTPVNWAEDTMLLERTPEANYGDGTRLNISGVEDDEAWALLTFDLADWQNPRNKTPIPDNVTFADGFIQDQENSFRSSGDLVLTYHDSMNDQDKGRTLEVLRVNRLWNESFITWEDVEGDSGFARGAAIDTSGTEFQDILTQDQRSFNIASYMDEVFDPESPATFFGVIVKDANPGQRCTSDASCRQTFYSSNRLQTDGSPRPCHGGEIGNCHPALYLLLDLNAPEAWNLTYDGVDSRREEVFVAPHHPINVTFRVRDPLGSLESVQMELLTENGTSMWTEELFASDNPASGYRKYLPDVERGTTSSYVMWRNASLDVPAGKYTVNITAVDSDDRMLNTNHRRANITVEATPPDFLGRNVTPTQGNEDITVTFNATVEDARGIEAVWAEITDPSGHVANTTNFTAVTTTGTRGNGTYEGSELFEDPGTFEVRIAAMDKAGNVATSDPITVELNDTTPPTLVDRQVRDAPVVRGGAYLQEIGGSLTFYAVARDNHALGANVTLVFDGPDGAQEVVHPERVDHETWLDRVWFNDTSTTPPGAWTVTFHVEDPQGNEPTSTTTVDLILEERAPPTLGTRSPQAWSNAIPTLLATLEDPNLDRATVELSTRVADGSFEPASSDVTVSQGVATVEAELGPYFHGQNITVRLNASDTLGESAVHTWSFRVDAVKPQSTLTFEGVHREALDRHEMPYWTLLSASGSDGDSGFHQVELRILPRDAGGSLEWTRVTGPVNVTDLPGYRGDGSYRLQHRAVDAVGNREPVQELNLLVDSRAPTLQHSREDGALYVTALDGGTGLHDLHVFYRNETVGFRELPVQVIQQVEGGGEFVVDLPFTPRGEKARVYLSATDNLGNTRLLGAPGVPGTRPITWTQGNHPPTVSITSPEDGSVVAGESTLLWDARDLDGDEVTVVVEASPVVLDTWRPVVNAEPGVHRVKWDTSSLPDGVYDLRVTASDGTDTVNDTVRVDVSNTELGVAQLDLPKGRLDVGEEVPVRVTLYRPVKSAEANVYIVEDGDRRLVATLTLRDDGRGLDEEAGDGTFSAAFEPGEKGRYEVGLNVLYGDDSRLEEGHVSSFTTESTLVGTIEKHRFNLIVAGVILLAVAAIVLVQLHRYGYI